MREAISKYELFRITKTAHIEVDTNKNFAGASINSVV